jgi:hypothetical protein
VGFGDGVAFEVCLGELVARGVVVATATPTVTVVEGRGDLVGVGGNALTLRKNDVGVNSGELRTVGAGDGAGAVAAPVATDVEDAAGVGGRDGASDGVVDAFGWECAWDVAATGKSPLLLSPA